VTSDVTLPGFSYSGKKIIRHWPERSTSTARHFALFACGI